MLNTLLIFLGAGSGGVFRHWISNLTYSFFGREFPYGTLVINVSGCFLMGLFFVFIIERLNGIEPQLRSLLLIGLLGGYTTFSSFSIETLSLFERGEYFSAALNVSLNIILCIAATWIGVFYARQL